MSICPFCAQKSLVLLDKQSRLLTAFIVPAQGQFDWRVIPMGLLGCPASFQRLMEMAMQGLVNVIFTLMTFSCISNPMQRDLIPTVSGTQT